MSQDVPGYGVAFRIDDYRNRPTMQPVPQPVKTQRRQQQDSLAKVNQAQKHQQTMPHQPPISMPITETKLTADDTAVLIHRRVPADKLFHSDRPFEITNSIEPKIESNNIQNKVGCELVSCEPKPESTKTEPINSEIKKTNNGISSKLKCVKYTCYYMCGCTICTTTIGLVIALCHEYLS